MDDEDGDFSLSTAARSRLSSLFVGDNTSGDVNQALTFTAPKQPRKNENLQNNPETFKLLIAAVVHAYKLKDGNYANQGKLGCAILGLHENSSYKFLLYKGKQIQVTACSIVPSFKFNIQPNNYVSIFDEKNENWSINFESETTLTDFAKQVALAKANSEGKNQSSLIIQELALGEGPSVDNGDAAEIRYSCWSLSNYSFGQFLDSNMQSESAFRLRLGKTKVIKGLSDGLIGAQKGTKRLLIIPPSLITEGATPSVPLNTTVIFEILVVKVKLSRESSHSPSPIKVPEAASEKKPELLPRPSISQEDNIRLRGASISEQLSQSPKKDKAQIISRMAKMGTATLPFQGAVAAHVSSESENEEEISPEEIPAHPNSSRIESSKSFTKPSSRKNSGSSVASQSAHLQAAQPQLLPENVALQVTQQSSQMALSSQVALPTQQAFVSPSPTVSFSTYQTAFPAQFPMHNLAGIMPTSMADTHLPLLITETRSQNTEVRLSLSKITDKIDTVLQKVDDLRLQQGRMPCVTPTPFLDSALLVQNIERIVQENKQLKEDVEAKNSKIQSLNEKICDLFQRNQRFFEESNNMLEQRSDTMQAVSAQSQAKLLNLENEKAKLSSDLLNATSKLAAMEEELNKSLKLENQLKQRLQEYEVRIERQSKDLNLEKESLVMSLQEKVKNAEDEREILIKNLSDLETQCKQLLESKTILEKLLKENESKVDEIRAGKGLKESHDDDSTNNVKMELLREENSKLLREKEELQSLIQELQKKLTTSEVFAESQERKCHELQSDLENSLTWKKKYEIFYERTRAMKEKYEDQINEFVAEIKQLKAAGSNPTPANFTGEIKKVMNALFKILQGKFEPNSSYQGSKVLELTLQSIRVLTFQMLEMKNRVPSTSSENDVESGKVINNTAGASFAAETDSSQSQASSLESSVNSTDAIVQQNGLNETHNTNTSCSPPVSGGVEASSDGDKSGNENNSEKPESKLVEETPSKQSECEQNGVDNSSDSKLSETSDSSKAEKTKTPSKETKDINRASPDLSQSLAWHALRSLAWKMFYAFLLLYVVFWIGAWVHDLETSATSAV
ncbi:FK506-binding protein 15-like isoform X2 [Argiope bruennichi]|uniref:FK506-binding protein 15-like isoform X2 n=1 Tax=Argiope bruennichi TaxID=94029 RepID=UPI00249580CA|nr:FK506-binding protein 15-like isoform X2 [Argiope bruennichi]